MATNRFEVGDTVFVTPRPGDVNGFRFDLTRSIAGLRYTVSRVLLDRHARCVYRVAYNGEELPVIFWESELAKAVDFDTDELIGFLEEGDE